MIIDSERAVWINKILRHGQRWPNTEQTSESKHWQSRSQCSHSPNTVRAGNKHRKGLGEHDLWEQDWNIGVTIECQSCAKLIWLDRSFWRQICSEWYNLQGNQFPLRKISPGPLNSISSSMWPFERSDPVQSFSLLKLASCERNCNRRATIFHDVIHEIPRKITSGFLNH